MEPVLDIFTHYDQIQSHKNAAISKENNIVKVYYNGSQVSAGFKFLFNSEPNREYRLLVNACLIRGDFAFIYCESQNKRLIDRKFFITATDNEYSLAFTSTDHRTFVGILFYNSDQEYELYVDKFQIYPAESWTLIPDLKNKIAITRQNEREIESIIHKNNEIMHEIRRQSLYDSFSNQFDDHDSDNDQFYDEPKIIETDNLITTVNKTSPIKYLVRLLIYNNAYIRLEMEKYIADIIVMDRVISGVGESAKEAFQSCEASFMQFLDNTETSYPILEKLWNNIEDSSYEELMI